jgi:ATP-dependent RNA helicase DDX56/DBP9
MKRKLDVNDVPSPQPVETTELNDMNEASFEALNLDPRLRQALTKENFSRPTLVQAKAIPLALEGKDILGIFSYIKAHD